MEVDQNAGSKTGLIRRWIYIDRGLAFARIRVFFFRELCVASKGNPENERASEREREKESKR